MRRFVAASLIIALAGCGDAKNMFVAKGKVAAQAGDLTLTPEQLAQILSGPRGMRVTKEAASYVTGLWVDYALFAQAAADGKLPRDSASAAKALWPELAEIRTSRWHDTIVARRPPADPSALDSLYSGNDVRVFQHILFGTGQSATPQVKTAARKQAEATLTRIKRGADFGKLASELSADPGSKGDNGYLPPARRGQFVPQFDSVGWALAPGAVSGVVETQFGYHIIKRPEVNDVRERLTGFIGQRGGQKADSAYMEQLAKSNNLEVAKNAGADMKAAVENPEPSRTSRKELTTFKGGKLTVAEYLRWVRALPPPYVAQLRAANDSALRQFARVLSLNLLLLREADSAKVAVSPDEWKQLYGRYTEQVDSLRSDLGFASADTALPDSVVAAKVSQYFDGLVSGKVRMRPVPSALGTLLRERGRYRVDEVGVSRGFDLAQA
ncbi:MAG TPA: peptidylprolyl isomerase, partial [Gemmatimonadales bacterium]|nr:peptidylprolyl isomerase [Gemmatimonadales bacterium]